MTGPSPSMRVVINHAMRTLHLSRKADSQVERIEREAGERGNRTCIAVPVRRLYQHLLLFTTMEKSPCITHITTASHPFFHVPGSP